MSITIDTTRFGTMETEKDKIINFPEGFLGFPQLTQYIYINRGEQDGPFAWMQAVEDPDVAFIVIDPKLVKPNYNVHLSEEQLEELNIKLAQDAQVFVIVNMPGELKDATVNLCGPVIISVKDCLGKQMVLDGPQYPLRYPLISQPAEKEQEVG